MTYTGGSGAEKPDSEEPAFVAIALSTMTRPKMIASAVTTSSIIQTTAAIAVKNDMHRGLNISVHALSDSKHGGSHHSVLLCGATGAEMTADDMWLVLATQSKLGLVPSENAAEMDDRIS